MNDEIPETMQAVAMHQFGGVEVLELQTLPVPQAGPGQVLMQVATAGIGSWDIQERAGFYADYLGTPRFPYVLGWEGSGTVVAIGDGVTDVAVGDRVYAVLVPQGGGGGFYAQYAVAEAVYVAPVPDTITLVQAGVMGWDALTALSGLDETLGVKPGERVLIFGASGGIGHLAVQLAKRLGAHVLAIASGEDGVALARQLGADAAVDGRKEDVVEAVRRFAPDGVDAALFTAGGKTAELVIETVAATSRLAYPNGITPGLKARPGVALRNYDARRGKEATARLHRLMEMEPFHVHVAQAFPLAQAAAAHRAVEEHYLGKLALHPHGT